MSHVLTLIAAPKVDAPGPGSLGRFPRGVVIAPEAVDAVRAALAHLGAETAAPDWLDDPEAAGSACDIAFAELNPDQADAAARAALTPFYPQGGLDVIAQKADGRKKAVLIADMDSTFVTGETLDELAAHAGIKDRIAAITARAMNGELDFRAALRERVGLLKGLPETTIDETYAEVRFTPGGRAAVMTMRKNGAVAVLISGGFLPFAGRVAKTCGFDRVFANDLVIENGKLTGTVAEPILDRDAKRATLSATAAEAGVGLEAALAVGDGANDLPMIQAAGLGVAFHGKPTVVAGARAALNFADLTGLLFAQGYRRSEFVTD
ncbi:phosphoserine phosphatase SerB [Oleispirillum naphthae]|uniref:phosphoserine phosphatase SerB n=1 Tax=Oleispirillum naphthae TaxID=2838853 RepID=UPI0030822CC4